MLRYASLGPGDLCPYPWEEFYCPRVVDDILIFYPHLSRACVLARVAPVVLRFYRSMIVKLIRNLPQSYQCDFRSTFLFVAAPIAGSNLLRGTLPSPACLSCHPF